MPRIRHLKEVWTRPLVLPAIALISGWAYFSTLYPGIGGRVNYGDSVKFQFLTFVDGLPHSPGFPLYLILTRAASKLFFFLPYPERTAFLSLVFGVLTLLVTHFLVRTLTSSPAVSFTVPLILGFSSTFWTQSTETEVYALNVFFVVTLCALFLRYQKTGKRSFLYLGVLLYALSFGNHLTVIGLLPALIYLVYSTDRSTFFSRRLFTAALVSSLAGSLQYLYVFEMAQKPMAYSEAIGQNPSFKQFFSYVTGGQFHGTAVQNAGVALIFKGVARFFLQLYLDFGLLILVLGVASILLCFRTQRDEGRRRTVRFLLLAFAGMTLVTIFYDIHDYRVYFLPSFALFTILLANIVNTISARNILIPVLTVLFITPVFLFLAHFPRLKVKENPIQSELSWIFSNLPDGSNFFFSKRGPFYYDGYLGAYYFKFKNEAEGKDIELFTDTGQIGPEPFYLTAVDLDLVAGLAEGGPEKVSLYRNTWVALGDLLQRMTSKQFAVIASTGNLNAAPLENRSVYGNLDPSTLSGRGGYLGLYARGLILFEEKDLKKPFAVDIKRGSDLKGFRFERGFSAHNTVTSRGSLLQVTVGGRKLGLGEKGLHVFVINGGTKTVDPYLFSSPFPGLGYPITMPPLYRVFAPAPGTT